MTNYSFPKGKVNQNENEMDCAIREVWEEVGYDISRDIKQGVFNIILNLGLRLIPTRRYQVNLKDVYNIRCKREVSIQDSY